MLQRYAYVDLSSTLQVSRGGCRSTTALHTARTVLVCKFRESTNTWQPRVDFLWSLDPFALCHLLVGAGQGRLWCKSFAGQPPWPVETVAFSTEKSPSLRTDVIQAPKERGRSAFQAPNPTMQAPCRRSDAFRIALRSLWRYEWPGPDSPARATGIACASRSGQLKPALLTAIPPCRSLPLASMSQTGDESELVAWCGVDFSSELLLPSSARSPRL